MATKDRNYQPVALTALASRRTVRDGTPLTKGSGRAGDGSQAPTPAFDERVTGPLPRMIGRPRLDCRNDPDGGPSRRVRRQAGKDVLNPLSRYGKRRFINLGSEHTGWTRSRAEDELQAVLRDVRRGVWQPAPAPPIMEEPRDPTFHEFASEWLAARRPELRATTAANYEWQLVHHLLPYFARHRLSQINVQEVDRYRHRKVAEGRLAAKSVNETIARLAQILEVAVEYELIEPNPASGGNGR